MNSTKGAYEINLSQLRDAYCEQYPKTLALGLGTAEEPCMMHYIARVEGKYTRSPIRWTQKIAPMKERS